MEQRVAVLGAGGTGHTLAADLTLAGYEVIFYEEPRYQESLKPALELGGVNMTGAARQGFAKIHKITKDIEEALKAPVSFSSRSWRRGMRDSLRFVLPL